MIGGEFEGGRESAELGGPVLELLGVVVALACLCLPVRVVEVMDCESGESWCALLACGVVEFGEVAQEHAGGPSIEDDVVYGQKDDVFLVIESQDRRAEERSVCEVEGSCGLGVDFGLNLCSAFAGCEVCEVVEWEWDGGGFVEEGEGCAV